VLGRGRLLVVAGGENSAGSTATVLLLDPATGRVETIGRLVTPGHDAAGAVLPSGELVIGGGVSASVATVQRLADNGRASVVGQLPRARSDLVAASVGSAVYVLGGYDGTTFQADILRTTDGRHFATVGTLPVPVRYPAVAVEGSTIYLFGGEQQNGPTDVVQAVDTTSGRARVVGQLPVPLGHATALDLGGRLLVAGGRTSHRASTRIWCFDPVGRRFTAVGRLPLAMSDAGAGVAGSVGYLVGGETQSALSRVVALRLR
jgi:N-acetylneuraminic acid mutarotase